MIFSEFSITVSKKSFKSKLEESTKFVYLFRTSNAEPDVNPLFFVIEPQLRIRLFGRCE